MGWWDDITGATGREAADQNMARLDSLKKEGLGYLNTGRKQSLAALGTVADTYAPLAEKYGAGSDLYLDSLGIRGAEGNQRAVDAFQTGPGYDFMVNQSLDALDRRAASRGLLGSGNNTIDTLNTVTGLANQEYGNWQNRLGGLIAPEFQATAGQVSMAPNISNVWQQDAGNRVNLASGVASGQNNANIQGANSQMAGAGNLANLGMSLATLGAQLPGMGGTGMLGGPINTQSTTLGRGIY